MRHAGLLTLMIGLTLAADAPAQRTGMAYGKAPQVDPQQIDRTAVAIQPKLGSQVPLELSFRDENDRPVTLAECCGKKPTILVMAYYRCPMLCNQVLNGLVDCLGEITEYEAGRDFNIVVVSFDPKDRPAIAWEKKQSYLRQFRDVFKRPADENGWHFLTGERQNIDTLCEAVGFKYEYDKQRKEFYHDSAIMVLTPEGKLSRYFFGIKFLSVDVRLGLVDMTGEGSIAPSLRDRVLMLCGIEYDHKTGQYNFTVMTALRITFATLVIALAAYLIWSWRRSRHQPEPVVTAALPQSDGLPLREPNPPVS